MSDLTRHKGQRNKLVKTLIDKGIRDKAVLKAVGKVPRHRFIDSSFEEYAYRDKPFPIGAGQTISQPYTVAFQTELLCLKPGQKALDVGTGSGYQAAILAEMGVKVFTIERQKLLFDSTRPLLQKLGYPKINMQYGDGYRGMPQHAPFHGIVVTAGAPYVPQDLIDQLAENGKLVIPVGEEVQVMKVFTKLAGGKIQEENLGDFRFVPMLHDKNNS